MEEPDFWDNPERSQEMHERTLKSLKDDMAIYHNLTEPVSRRSRLLIEMGYEENDAAVHPGDPGDTG